MNFMISSQLKKQNETGFHWDRIEFWSELNNISRAFKQSSNHFKLSQINIMNVLHSFYLFLWVIINLMY